MAARFWVGGTGNWDAATTTHWSATTGGAGGASVPGASDDVTFDGNSGGGIVTVTATHSVLSITGGAHTGTVNFNGQTMTIGTLSWSGAGARTLTLGAANISITATTGTPWNMTTVTSLVFNANTSTITFSGNGAVTFAGGGLTYNNVSFTGNNTNTISGTNTFNNLSMTATATAGTQNWIFSSDQTINGTLTTSATNTASNCVRILICFAVFSGVTTQRTLTAAAVSLTNTDFNYINAQGVSSPWSGTNLGDSGGNSNITFADPRTLYWIGNAGSWTNLAHWSTSSNGVSATTTPLGQDNVIFDAFSITLAAQTIIVNLRILGGNMDISAVANNPTFALGAFNPGIVGNFTGGISSWTASNATLNFIGTGIQTFKTNGVTWGASLSMSFSAKTGSYTLQDDLILNAGSITFATGTIDANGHNVTCTTFGSNNSQVRTINMGSGIWTLTGTGTVWQLATTTGLTLNASAATILITDTSATSKTFNAGPGSVYKAITITGGGTGAVIFANTSTLGDFTVNPPKTITFSSSQTRTFTSFIATGSPGNIITINSSTPGTPATLSKSSGTVECDYLSLQDSTAQGGATFHAGAHSTNVSGNTGWTFESDQTQAGLSRITATSPQTILGKGDILKTAIQPQIGLSRIQVITNQAQAGLSRIQQVVSKATGGKANIVTPTNKTTTGKTKIVKKVWWQNLNNPFETPLNSDWFGENASDWEENSVII